MLSPIFYLSSSSSEEGKTTGVPAMIFFLFFFFIRPTRDRAIYVDRSTERTWIRSRYICIVSRNSPREFRFFAPRNNGDINLRDQARSSLKERTKRKNERKKGKGGEGKEVEESGVASSSASNNLRSEKRRRRIKKKRNYSNG